MESHHLPQAGAGGPRRTLRAEDLDVLVQVSRAGDPEDIFRAVEALSAEVIGHTLFTIMQFDAAASEVERVYSSNPAAYPVGGRKQKKNTAWALRVLGERQVFRANDREAIREAFDDHETIFGLGIGSMLNVPVAFAGRCLGTMNLSNVEGWFTAEDECTGLLLGTFVTSALMDRRLPQGN
jgi:GAF domain-containing protein